MARITPSISLNEEEQKTLAEWKKFCGEPDTSRALKHALNFSRNVALNLFGSKLSGILSTRVKYDKLEKDLEKQINL